MKKCEEKLYVQCVGWTLEWGSQCEGLVHGRRSVWKEDDSVVELCA